MENLVSIKNRSGLKTHEDLGSIASKLPFKRYQLPREADSPFQALCLYLVGSNDKPPKEAAYLGKAGWMDVDALLISAKLLTKEGGKLHGFSQFYYFNQTCICIYNFSLYIMRCSKFCHIFRKPDISHISPRRFMQKPFLLCEVTSDASRK